MLRLSVLPDSADYQLTVDEVITAIGIQLDPVVAESLVPQLSAECWLKLTMTDGSVGWVRPLVQKVMYPHASRHALHQTLTVMLSPNLSIESIELHPGTATAASSYRAGSAAKTQSASSGRWRGVLGTWTPGANQRVSKLNAASAVPIQVVQGKDARGNPQATFTWSGPYTLTLVKVDGNGARTALAIKAAGPSITLPTAAPTSGGYWECNLYDGVVKRTFAVQGS